MIISKKIFTDSLIVDYLTTSLQPDGYGKPKPNNECAARRGVETESQTVVQQSALVV